MTTKFIGIKEFRQNMAKYAKRAQSGKVRLVVMKRNQPLFEIKSFAEDKKLDSFYEDIAEEVLQAEKDVAAGKFVTREEIMKEFSTKS